MTLKTNEINSLKKQIQIMEASNKTTLINANNYEQKANRLEEQVKILQKDLSFTTQVSYIINHLWANIIEAIHLQWPSIQIIYEQRDILLIAQKEIQRTTEELADKPTQAHRLITFLNSKNRTELEELKIQDRTEAILDRKSTRLNSSHLTASRMPSSA